MTGSLYIETILYTISIPLQTNKKPGCGQTKASRFLAGFQTLLQRICIFPDCFSNLG